MSATQRLTGHQLVVIFQTGGQDYVISGDQTSLEITYDTNEADMTAGSDQYTYMKPTTKINGATMTCKYIGTAGTATWGNLPQGTEGTLVYGPEGTAQGKPKGGFPCYLKSKPFSIPYNDGIVRTATFSPQGGSYGTSVFDPDTHTFGS